MRTGFCHSIKRSNIQEERKKINDYKILFSKCLNKYNKNGWVILVSKQFFAVLEREASSEKHGL